MSKNTRISIIVPVYNIEKYIDRCIRSILSQEYNDFEIILVDDGSTDKSGTLCDQWCSVDARVKVIHTLNKGLSEARNLGIISSKGEYILFVDGDDFIVENTLNQFEKELWEFDYDIIAGNGCIYLQDGTTIPKVKERVIEKRNYSGSEFLYQNLKKSSITMCSTMAMYRRDFLVENELFFRPGLYHEDELWTPKVYLTARNVTFISGYFYMHFKRNDSIMNSANHLRRAKDLVLISNELYQMYIHIDNKELRNELLDYVATLYLSGIYSGKLSKIDKGKYINKRLVLASSKSIRNRIKSFIFILSPSFYCFVNESYKKLRRSI